MAVGAAPAANTLNHGDRRAVTGWVLYDLANTMFSFVVLSFYFGPWIVDGLGNRDSMITVPQSLAMVVVLACAPFLGALADHTRRIPLLVTTTLVAVVMTMALGTGHFAGLGARGTTFVAIAAFVVANIGYQLGLVLYDALLPVIAPPDKIGRIGSIGVGVGYMGSLVGLGAGTLILGRWTDGEPLLFLATGLLFFAFAIPCFLWVKEAPPAAVHRMQLLRRTARETMARLRAIPTTPRLGRFLLTRILYADAVNTLLLILGIYAVTEAGFTTDSLEYTVLLGLGIIMAIVTAPLWGMLVDRRGATFSLKMVLMLWLVTLGLVALHPILGLPQRAFMLYGALLGVGLAGTWSSDRPLLVALAPPDQVGAWFGLYALAGRFAAIIGPLIWSLTVDVFFRDNPYARPIGVALLFVQVLASRILLQGLAHDGRQRTDPMAA